MPCQTLLHWTEIRLWGGMMGAFQRHDEFYHQAISLDVRLGRPLQERKILVDRRDAALTQMVHDSLEGRVL